jgi:hypothetical protein
MLVPTVTCRSISKPCPPDGHDHTSLKTDSMHPFLELTFG